MSYLVLARKWRPQNFDEVVAQEHITRTLKNSIQSGKLSHAYLFVGPRGVGKTSCARILAKSLNCQDAPTVHPCGKCSACIEIAQGRSLDVIEIDGASNRGIDEIRTLRENVKFASILGKYKIYIIDEVHMLTQEAFNALLKTLEEPPEHVKFIFATTQPHKVLPTILSRCQRFEFGYIPTLKIIAKLKEIAQKEKIGLDENVLFDIARLAEGSMRDAESLLDQLASFSQDKITSKDILSIMGVIDDNAFLELIQAIKNRDSEFCINFISKLFMQGKDIHKFLEGFMFHIRNLMMSKIMKANLEQICDMPKEKIEKIKEQSKDMSLADIVAIFSEITTTQDMAKKIGSYRIPLEVMMIKLTKKELVSKAKTPVKPVVGEPKDKSFVAKLKLDNVGSLFRSSKKHESSPEKKEHKSLKTDQEPKEKDNSLNQDSPTAVNFEEVRNNWLKVIEDLSGVKMSLATYLKDSKPLRLDNNILVIGFLKNSLFYKEAVEQRQNTKILNDRLKGLFGTRLSFQCEIMKEEPSEEIPKTAPKYLNSVLDTFQGRVINKE